MSETQTKKASDVEIGDLLHFPNSRHPQEVTMTQKDETHITFEAGSATRWVVPLDQDVNCAASE